MGLALANGVYVVSAAGNDGGSDDDGRVASPSNVREVISVGALDEDGDVWSGSSLGSPEENDGINRSNPHFKPEISAPGVNIISTAAGDGYYSSTGTSDATVFVSGILALILGSLLFLRDLHIFIVGCVILLEILFLVRHSLSFISIKINKIIIFDVLV